MARHPWLPPADPLHDEDFPYYPGRKLMITEHQPPEPFAGPSYYRQSDTPSDFDVKAVIDNLVTEHLPRGTDWPANDGTESSQHVELTIEKTISTTNNFGSQVVLCKLTQGQKVEGIPARVVAKIYDPLYYLFLKDASHQPTNVVCEADIDLSREAAVYQHFKINGKDGESAPRYYGAFTTPIRSNIMDKYRPVCLILLEYIEGFTMKEMCSISHYDGPALVPGPYAGNDEQRMLVMKQLLDIESCMRHAGVVYGNVMPENVMISRPSSDKTNPASEPRVVIIGWKLADVECKEVDYKPLIELLPRPVTPADWNTASENDQFQGWIPLEYFDDEQKFADWLEDSFGGENAKKCCRKAELKQIRIPSLFRGASYTLIDD
ncbi:hypothetical protein ACHAQH_008895 [Verticillium albo-atrum]